jgi:LysM domain
MMKCRECGNEFELRHDHRGYANVCPACGRAAEDEGAPHTVVHGDTLRKIAADRLGDADRYMEIFTANRDQLSNPDCIWPGQVLKIPRR